jgi:formylglycine-generating enzyme required for sulfatase activity
LGKYEVTRGQFAAFVDATGRRAQGCWALKGKAWAEQTDKSWRDPGFPQTDDHPAVCVSFEDAQAYIRWLNTKTGQVYRLPTEAEWEYAARTGTKTIRPWGDNADGGCGHANVADRTAKHAFPDRTIHECSDGYVYTAPVGRFLANDLKLHDVLGNAREWTCSEYTAQYSVYTAKYEGHEKFCSNDATGGRAVRGGSWTNEPYWVRSAYRDWSIPAFRFNDIGFRLAQD